MGYPTKEQILSREVKIGPQIINDVLKWKKDYYKGWKDRTKVDKMTKIRALILQISLNYYDNYSEEDFLNNGWKVNGYRLKVETGPGYEDCCETNHNEKRYTIYLDENNPSIITAFHELAHAIYGGSELKACRWSIWLFKNTFPKSYGKLKWRNHMLVK